MLWQQDLTRDIRSHTEQDNEDRPMHYVDWAHTNEHAGVQAAKDFFKTIAPNVKTILEIGVNEFGFTQTWTQLKNKDTIYIGVDMGDRSSINNIEHNIHTIRANSSDIADNIAKFKELGCEQFDFIYIDGWHSINQVLTDWEYTKLLAPNGYVGFHDTNHHPGPKGFISAIDQTRWQVQQLAPQATDWGFTVVSLINQAK